MSKALVILHLPFVAFVLALLYADRRHYYAEHFVVTLHYFAFALLMVTTLVQLVTVLQPLVPSFDAVVPMSALDRVARFPHRLGARGRVGCRAHRSDGRGQPLHLQAGAVCRHESERATYEFGGKLPSPRRSS